MSPAWRGAAPTDLVGSLVAQCAQVYGGPGAERPPGLGYVGEGVAWAVAFGDFGVEPALVAGEGIWRVRAADDYEFCGERSKSLDRLDSLHCLIRVERP